MKLRRYLLAAATALVLTGAQASTALAADPVVAAAGDIACAASGSSGGSCKQGPTSDLLVAMNPDAVLPLGDVQYESGEYNNFVNVYNPTWGRLLAKTYPALGNHELNDPAGAAKGYFDYYNGINVFSGRAGDRNKGYYSFNLGTWHLVSLNSNCSYVGGCGANDPMAVWLRNDLAANPSHCTLVYAHHPRWTSDTRDFDKPEIGPLMQILFDNHVELYLVGHSHFYERFAPTRPDQTIDRSRGFRQLIVGTGGRNVYGFGAIEPASEIRNGNTFGVIKLTLRSGSYDWQFLPIAGQTFTDSGTDVCHSAINDPTPPTAPTNLAAQAVGGSAVDLSWTAATDNVAVAGYRIFRNGAQIATTGATTYRDGTVSPSTSYSYHVRAYDSNGNLSPQSNTANATTGPPDRLVTVSVSEDATISSAAPSTNFGAATMLEVDNSPILNTLLKFNVSGVGAGTVTSAKVRLYNVESSDSGGAIHRAANSSWTQGGVTWNTAPAADPVVLGSLGAVQPNNWYELAVTPSVTGDGVVSFRMDSTSANGADYSSREGTGFAAQLVLTVADPPADSQPPTAPSNLTANAISTTRVDLAWTASTDNVGVAGYRIFRDGAQLTTTTATSYSDTTASPSTTYAYHVVAYDAVPNVSPPSNTANATTPDDPPPPPPPSDETLTFGPTDDATIKLATPGSNFGAATTLEVDNSPVLNTLLKFNVTGIGARSVTNARLRLYNLNPSNLGGNIHLASSNSWTQGTVTWNSAPAADPIVLGSLGAVASGAWHEVTVTAGVTGDGQVSFRIDSTSVDGAHYSPLEGASGFAPQLVVTVQGSSTPDTEAPTAPSNLTANAFSSTRVDLAWTGSTDNVAVTGYRIYRNGAELTTTTATSYSDTTVSPSTPYAYYVVAYDARPNVSEPSNTASATTPAAPAEETLRFTVSDDATVEQALPTNNFGMSSRIHVDNSPVRNMLLKFAVSGTGGRTLVSAKLRLHCVDPATIGGAFFLANPGTSWSQSTVTWNTAPAATGSALATLGSVVAGTWYEVDLSSAVTGDGTYTFRASSPSTNGADYSSREGAATLRPELVVVVR